MLSPAPAIAAIAMNWADWPDEAATAATPPSKAATRYYQPKIFFTKDNLFEDFYSWIHDAGVNVSEFLESEANFFLARNRRRGIQTSSMSRVVEDVGCSSIDWNSSCIGRWIRSLP